MEIPLLEGRDIATADVREAPRVLVISERVARKLFPGRSPIGESVYVGSTTWPAHEVIGVVADARVNQVFLGPDPAMYMATYQLAPRQMQLAIRTNGSPLRFVEPVSRIVREMDKDVLFAKPTTLQSVVDRSTSGFQMVTLSSGVFSAIALALAAIGLYGLLAHSVHQRLHELGIRMAIGATRTNLLQMIFKRGVVLVGFGLALGAVGALMITLALQKLPFEAQTVSAGSYVGAVLVLALVAASACLLPAWKATQVSPIDVLRQE
jgi:putative ABC transport system permease protein